MRVVVTDTDTIMQHLHARIVDELEYKPSVNDVRALCLLHTCTYVSTNNVQRIFRWRLQYKKDVEVQ